MMNTARDLYREREKAPSARDELILKHMPMVRYLVGRISPQLPTHLDQQDLMSAAVVGLINAADRFDPGRGVQFKTFAEQHIRGTIIDELRSHDVLSRTMRDKQKKLSRHMMSLEHQLGRNPTSEEVARSLGISMDEYHDLLDDVHVYSFISLDDSWDDDEGNTLCLVDVLTENDAKSPQQQVMMKQLTEALGQAIDMLPEKERLVVTLYYNEDLNLKEIGEILSLTESRISQILSQAMSRLRVKMKLHRI